METFLAPKRSFGLGPVALDLGEEFVEAGDSGDTWVIKVLIMSGVFDEDFAGGMGFLDFQYVLISVVNEVIKIEGFGERAFGSRHDHGWAD